MALLAASVAINVGLAGQVASQQDAVSAAQISHEGVEKARDVAFARVAELEGEREDVEAQLVDLKKEVAASGGPLDEAETEAEELRAELAEHVETIESLNADLAAAQAASAPAPAAPASTPANIKLYEGSAIVDYITEAEADRLLIDGVVQCEENDCWFVDR